MTFPNHKHHPKPTAVTSRSSTCRVASHVDPALRKLAEMRKCVLTYACSASWRPTPCVSVPNAFLIPNPLARVPGGKANTPTFPTCPAIAHIAGELYHPIRKARCRPRKVIRHINAEDVNRSIYQDLNQSPNLDRIARFQIAALVGRRKNSRSTSFPAFPSKYHDSMRHTTARAIETCAVGERCWACEAAAKEIIGMPRASARRSMVLRIRPIAEEASPGKLQESGGPMVLDVAPAGIEGI
ncbi:uncharacterized protein M421DRAFT_419646, partial [Didymella exigua CBS 183.55]